jgi:hypothetical protein
MTIEQQHRFQVVSGLPPYGPLAIPFPRSGRSTHFEGFVVRFVRVDGSDWTGNFLPGLTNYSDAFMHPDRRRVLIVSRGDTYLVDPEDPDSYETLPGWVQNHIWSPDHRHLILDDAGLRLTILADDGSRRSTRRFSYDGLAELATDGTTVRGLAYEPCHDSWQPFTVDIASCEVEGGTYNEPLDIPSPRRFWQFWRS